MIIIIIKVRGSKALLCLSKQDTYAYGKHCKIVFKLYKQFYCNLKNLRSFVVLVPKTEHQRVSLVWCPFQLNFRIRRPGGGCISLQLILQNAFISVTVTFLQVCIHKNKK